jgi:hypothetical protein
MLTLLTLLAFLIACIISFRALFAQRENQSYENQRQAQQIAWQQRQTDSSSGAKRMKNLSLIRRARMYHDSLLQSFKSLETGHDMRLPEPESGRFSPTFLTEINSNGAAKEKSSTSSQEEPELVDRRYV